MSKRSRDAKAFRRLLRREAKLLGGRQGCGYEPGTVARRIREAAALLLKRSEAG